MVLREHSQSLSSKATTLPWRGGAQLRMFPLGTGLLHPFETRSHFSSLNSIQTLKPSYKSVTSVLLLDVDTLITPFCFPRHMLLPSDWSVASVIEVSGGSKEKHAASKMLGDRADDHYLGLRTSTRKTVLPCCLSCTPV